MPFFDIAVRKPFVKALVGRKGKGNKGTGADTGKQRRPSWVRLGRSIAAKGKLQSQERLRKRSSVAGTLRMASSTSTVCVCVWWFVGVGWLGIR